MPGTPGIYVLAGTNGAGKSSLGGAMLRRAGADYFNPDEVAREIAARNPSLSLPECNGLAWEQGRRLLERAIAERLTYAFETTLGGDTMTALLILAATGGHEVRIWYAGLDSPERHIARVRARVAVGGHDIPEAKIRERFVRSRQNLIRLLPLLTELFLFDNSTEGDPREGRQPAPVRILHYRRGRVVDLVPLPSVPSWAKPIVVAALG